eukprot:SAG31_NODE_10855_length_1090_cov_0.872856_1_plen_76_part_10
MIYLIYLTGAPGLAPIAAFIAACVAEVAEDGPQIFLQVRCCAVCLPRHLTDRTAGRFRHTADALCVRAAAPPPPPP